MSSVVTSASTDLLPVRSVLYTIQFSKGYRHRKKLMFEDRWWVNWPTCLISSNETSEDISVYLQDSFLGFVLCVFNRFIEIGERWRIIYSCSEACGLKHLAYHIAQPQSTCPVQISWLLLGRAPVHEEGNLELTLLRGLLLQGSAAYLAGRWTRTHWIPVKSKVKNSRHHCPSFVMILVASLW